MKRIISICIATFLLTGTAAVKEITSGTAKSEVYTKIGAPEKMSFDGRKEIYAFLNGKRAILRYYDDILDDGFLIINFLYKSGISV